jgi:hypothetical protein
VFFEVEKRITFGLYSSSFSSLASLLFPRLSIFQKPLVATMISALVPLFGR